MQLRAFALLVLAACGTGADDATPDDDDLAGLDALDGKADGTSSWTLVGTGVAYQQVNTGAAIVIAYGGYTARLSDSATWASELVDARLGAAGVGHIFAVRGPADPAYAGREIANTKLRAFLAGLPDGTAPIFVVAHSSGSFVAHELLGQLENAGSQATLARISYADLDGGGSGLSDSIVASLGGITFVYAHDPTLASGYSHNSSTATALAAEYAPKATSFEVTVPTTGCVSGAGWCLHDVVITHRPHNPSTFDLARDYTDFDNHPVTTEYLNP